MKLAEWISKAEQDARDLVERCAREFWERVFIKGFPENSADDNAKEADEAVAEWRKRFAPKQEVKS